MKINKFIKYNEQFCNIGNNEYNVARLIELSKELPVMEIPLDHLRIKYSYDNITLREMVMHMMAVQDADLNYPIILDEDGCLMDGRHRIMKSILHGHETIKAVRFEENPWPDRRLDD